MSDELDKISRDIAACRLCIDSPNGTPLPHEPRPVVRLSSIAKICIAGQAPGLRVHKSGIPFDDPSGDRLRQWMGVSKEEFYDTKNIAIVPMGFCFPGYDAKKSDLPPRKECRKAWHDAIFQHMPQVELILVIGQYAQAYHLGNARKKSLTETVMNWRELFAAGTNPQVLPLPHPSWRNTGWLKKNLWFEEELLPVLREKVKSLRVARQSLERRVDSLFWNCVNHGRPRINEVCHEFYCFTRPLFCSRRPPPILESPLSSAGSPVDGSVRDDGWCR